MYSEKTLKTLRQLRLIKGMSVAVIMISVACAAFNLFEHFKGKGSTAHAVTLPLVLISSSFLLIACCNAQIHVQRSLLLAKKA